MQNLRHLARIPTGISYLLRREHVWGQPVFFTIETVNSCNFRCIYCPQSDPKNHFVNGRGIMSLDDFKRIIANLRSAFDLRIVSLHRDGEPLLNKRLDEYISHLTQLGTCVTVSSNCSLISEQRAGSLIASGLQMVGTDFCADAALYERLRERGIWQETLTGIRNLLRAAASGKTDFRVVIKDIATDHQPPEQAERVMEETRKLFLQDQDRVTVMPVYFHNALGESLTSINAAPADAAPSTPLPRVDLGAFYTLCHQPWVNLTVDFAGRVVGCCRDLRSEYVVGNLLEEPAADIWNGERMKRLRRALAAERPEDIDICRSCDVPRNGSYSGRSPLAKIRTFFFSGAWKR